MKINGLRIELGEIEAAIKSLRTVSEAAVVAAAGHTRLVGFFSGEATRDELKEVCNSRLPPYMVPHAFIHVESWPRTTSAKLDRNALLQLGVTL